MSDPIDAGSMTSDPAVADPGPTAAGQPDTAMCVLSYLGLLALIPLFVKKDDPFIQWHAKQGLLFSIAVFVVMVVISVLAAVVASAIGLLNIVVWLAWLGITIVCIMKAVKGEKFAIPVISDFIGKVPSAT